MNYEKDDASSWTVVMRQKRKSSPSISRHPKSLEQNTFIRHTDANFKEKDGNINTFRLEKGVRDTFAHSLRNFGLSECSVVVRKLFCEVSSLKEQIQGSHWWRELYSLLFSQDLVCRNIPSHVVISSKFTTAEEVCSRKRVGKLICYGLGSFERSAVSRYQLALAKILQECCISNIRIDHFYSKYSCSSIYDPVMSSVDKELCTLLGFVQDGSSCQCSSQCLSLERLQPGSVGTEREVEDFCRMFFMPHCGRSLYNIVLKENWTRNRLHQVIILGNSFSFYQTFGKTVDLDSYLGLASGWMKELKCPNAQFSPLYEAFNDLSVHIFPIENLPAESDPVWTTSHREIPLD
ncbi:hypothetical protein GpartN1_g2150.t1 [Galdieria partita]|uniref:SRR1-like domain-containing protein n=1 Tax=Galdieria partita TaxID=83374 RepID=A0A9C7UNY3_9RHOD|nr:hypothetical protein GpartN1_g2150.t1 [Galdieria partita]